MSEEDVIQNLVKRPVSSSLAASVRRLRRWLATAGLLEELLQGLVEWRVFSV